MNFSPRLSIHIDIFQILILLFFINSTCGKTDSFNIKQKIFPHNPGEVDGEYWMRQAQETLRQNLKLKLNYNVAKNIIFFLGDGMGVTTVTAGRIYKGQLQGQSGEEGWLEFDKFPHVGLVKTYNFNKQVPDSASTATAYLCGIKTKYKTIGVTARTIYQNCDSSIGNEVYSILAWAQDAGKETGLISTARVTHASPSGLYAHVAYRDWESDVNKTGKWPDASRCKDIARQLVEDSPGKHIKVIMGGGRGYFIPKTQTDMKEQKKGLREDGKDLIEDWKYDKRSRNLTYKYMPSKEAFDDWDPSNEEYVLGLFNYSHMAYDTDRGTTIDEAEPSIAEMTEKAVRRLQRSKAGFFLFVEGGRIDMAHHDSKIRMALEETVAMDLAVKRAVELTSEDDTLILVTADHSHPMTINGYPARGTTVLGFAGNSNADDLPYTTLMYTNGVDYPRNGSSRADLTHVNIGSKLFTPQTAVPMIFDTHGGEDVAVYARGPMAHLLDGVHEQNYIPHALAYAACIGLNLDHCASRQSNDTNTNPRPTFRPRTSFSPRPFKRNIANVNAPLAHIIVCLILYPMASLL